MAESPHSDASHDSHDESNTGSGTKNHAAKDRECRYCHQKFTSSSLGRHLDQFLSKKKPDGIHDVDEIRHLRGRITRRIARNSSRHEHDEGEQSNTSPPPVPVQTSPPLLDTLNHTPVNGLGVKFNAMNWHSTGVINDLATTKLASPSPLTPSGTKRSFAVFAQPDQSASTEKEKDSTIRALELSLREVLDSLKAATVRSTPRSVPLDFDVQAQTYPSLCLLLLPHPPTLFTPSPFPSSTSASIKPPDSTQLPLLRLNLESSIQNWKWGSLRLAQTYTFPTPTSANIGEEADYLTRTATAYQTFATKHLENAYDRWMSLSSESRTAQWQTELMRAYAKEKEKTATLGAKLEKLQQEANQLQGQVEHLSRCQWPREMALWPPERVPLNSTVLEEVRGMNLHSNTNSSDSSTAVSAGEKWDFDRIVNKWKKRVREDRSRTVAPHHHNSTPRTEIPPPSHIVADAVSTTAVTDQQPPPLPAHSLNPNLSNGISDNDARKILRRQSYSYSNSNNNNGAVDNSSNARRKSVRQQALVKEIHATIDGGRMLNELIIFGGDGSSSGER